MSTFDRDQAWHALPCAALHFGGELPRDSDLLDLPDHDHRFVVTGRLGPEDGIEAAAASGLPHLRSDASGWELLVDGMAFELTGMPPDEPLPPPPVAHRHRLPASLDLSADQRLMLRAGPHLAGGARMVPVLRAMAGLAASLAELPGLDAVCWVPARNAVEPSLFRIGVCQWLGRPMFPSVSGGSRDSADAEGPFPALALAAFAETEDGALTSEGLALFCGQEIRVDARLCGTVAQRAALGFRIMHHLVSEGPLETRFEVDAPDGTRLALVPDGDGALVRVGPA